MFAQNLKKFSYFSFNLLISLCESLPVVVKNKKYNKTYYSLIYRTRSYPFLKEIYSLFYSNVNGKFLKYISDDLLLELNPKVLAFWFMDEGS